MEPRIFNHVTQHPGRDDLVSESVLRPTPLTSLINIVNEDMSQNLPQSGHHNSSVLEEGDVEMTTTSPTPTDIVWRFLQSFCVSQLRYICKGFDIVKGTKRTVSIRITRRLHNQESGNLLMLSTLRERIC
eukprot:IDg9819t1